MGKRKEKKKKMENTAGPTGSSRPQRKRRSRDPATSSEESGDEPTPPRELAEDPVLSDGEPSGSDTPEEDLVLNKRVSNPSGVEPSSTEDPFCPRQAAGIPPGHHVPQELRQLLDENRRQAKDLKMKLITLLSDPDPSQEEKERLEAHIRSGAGHPQRPR